MDTAGSEGGSLFVNDMTNVKAKVVTLLAAVPKWEFAKVADAVRRFVNNRKHSGLVRRSIFWYYLSKEVFAFDSTLEGMLRVSDSTSEARKRFFDLIESAKAKVSSLKQIIVNFDSDIYMRAAVSKPDVHPFFISRATEAMSF